MLYDSDPKAEEEETELKVVVLLVKLFHIFNTKASALLSAIRGDTKVAATKARPVEQVGRGLHILLVDHQDSFVMTLADYFRQTGATVVTVRTPVPTVLFDDLGNGKKPDLVHTSFFFAAFILIFVF